MRAIGIRWRAGMGRVGATVLAVSGLVMAVSPGHAAAAAGCGRPRFAMTAADVTARHRAIEHATVSMTAHGRTERQIASALWARFKVRTLTKPAATARHPNAFTTGNSIVLSQPVISYDSCAHEYIVHASWSFTNAGASSVISEEAQGCDGCDVGGTDAFGFAFNRGVAINSENEYTWGQTTAGHYAHSDARTWLDDANNAGVVFIGQDRVNNAWSDYSFWHGEMFLYPTVSCTSALYGRTRYLHNYSSAHLSIDSVAIPLGITLTNTTSSHGWTKYSSSSNTSFCA